jgi:hypothetical protein
MNTITLYHRDGYERTFDVGEHARMAGCGQVGAGKDWSSVKPPPLGWERETPKYRVTRDVQPAPKARFRLEPPFTSVLDSNSYQYGQRPLKAGEIIETREWPHPSFFPLNYSAEKVLAFFNAAMKSRLPLSPWQNGQVRLDDGLTGQTVVHLVPPQLQPMNLKPHRN